MLFKAFVFVTIAVLVGLVLLRRRLPDLAGWATDVVSGGRAAVSFTGAVRAAVRAGTRRLDGARNGQGEYVAPSSSMVFEFRPDVWETTIAPVGEAAEAAVADGIADLTGIDPGELSIRLCSAPLDSAVDGPLVTLLPAGQVSPDSAGGTVCPPRPSAATVSSTRFRLRTVGSGHTVSRLPEGRVVTIGRGTGNSVRLTDPAVSARHLTLVAGTDHVRLTDRGTSNGTIVNGNHVKGVVLLRHGDTISIGEHARWEVFDAEHASVPPVAVLDPDLAPGTDDDAPYDLDDEDKETPDWRPEPEEPQPEPANEPQPQVGARSAAKAKAEPVATVGPQAEPPPLPAPPRRPAEVVDLRTQPMRWSDRPVPRHTADGPVAVGTTSAGERLPLRALSGDVGDLGNGHVLIVGTSGAGKTQFSRSLVAQAIRRGVTALVVDPADEYGDVGVRSVNVWRDGIDASPMVPVSGADVDRTTFELVDAMATGVASYGGGARLGHRQTEALRQALLDTYEATGQARWPVLQDLHDHLSEDLKGVLAPITDRRVFAAGRPLGDLIGDNVALNLADFPGTTGASRLAVGLTLASVGLRAATLPPAPGSLRHLVVLDEAHRAKGFGAVQSMLREGRRAGIGVVLVSQAPDDMPEIALAVASTTIVFRLGPKAAEQAAEHLGDPRLAAKISRLAPGECYVHEAGARPVRVDAVQFHRDGGADDIEVAG